MSESVFVIAEAGVNHNGDEAMARALIDVAAEAGADAVKFQTFRATSVVSARAPKADYQKAAVGEDGSQLDMVRKLELGADSHHRLAAYAASRGIEFMSTPFDLESLSLLLELRVKRLKVPSGEIANGPYLLAMARARLPLIVSTGMATLAEIDRALALIAFGQTEDGDPPPELLRDAHAPLPRPRDVVLLHCTTEYPAPDAEVNLRAITTLADRYGLPVGFSDHSEGTVAAVGAVALGATVVEKHITLSVRLPGPDHAASLAPDRFADLVRDVRRAAVERGSGVKAPTTSEQRNLVVARRSLVAAREVRAGERFDSTNVTAKRPGDGVSPMRYWELLGRVAERSYAADEPIDARELPIPH